MSGYATIMSTFWSGSFIVEPRPLVNNALSTLLLVSSDSTLDGDRYRLYSSLDSVIVDEGDGFVSATALAMATVAFGQSPAPSMIAIGRRDAGASETFAQALAAISADGLQFGLVAADSTTAAQATSVASYTDANPMISAVVSADSAWGTGTPPAGFPTTSASLAVLIHPTAGQYPHVALLARAAGTPADSTRPDFTASLAQVSSYNLTETQRANALTNHANPLVPLESGGSLMYPPAGGARAMSDEYLYTRFAVMYLTYRWRSAIANQYARFASQNKVWPYNTAGESALRGCLQPAINNGLAVGYFTPNDTLPQGYEVSTSRSGGVITATARIGLLDGTTQVVTVTYLERAA
jgi:hypothetical protein